MPNCSRANSRSTWRHRRARHAQSRRAGAGGRAHEAQQPGDRRPSARAGRPPGRACPRSSRNSLRWKPAGSFCRIVCSMTRGPAKPMSAFGSARMQSPSIAKLAVTPPVVGSVSTERNGQLRPVEPRQRRRHLGHLHQRQRPFHHPGAALARHDERPPIALLERASRWRRTSFSPITTPMLPPMNPYSMARHDGRHAFDGAGADEQRVLHARWPSGSAASRAAYGLVSVKVSGSFEARPASCSTQCSSSKSERSRSIAP